MDPRQAYEQRERLQLVDVREPDEWAAGHIGGALHIPMSAIAARHRELGMDLPIVTVCRSGTRAAVVTAALNQAGYRAQTLEGGMKAWAAAGLPMASDIAHPARVA